MMIFVLFPYLSKISIYLFFSKGKVLCTLPAGNLVTHCVPPPLPAVSLGARGNLPFREGVSYPIQQLLLDTLVIK